MRIREWFTRPVDFNIKYKCCQTYRTVSKMAYTNIQQNYVLIHKYILIENADYVTAVFHNLLIRSNNTSTYLEKIMLNNYSHESSNKYVLSIVGPTNCVDYRLVRRKCCSVA